MAASMNGTSDKYQLAGETTLRYEWSNSWSVHAWVYKPSTANSACIVGKANNAPPAADQRGWALNFESQSGELMVSFHLVNDASPALHAYKVGKNPAGIVTGMQPGFWVPIGATYNGNGSPTGMHVYANGTELQTQTTADTLAGNTILVNGTPVTICGFDTEFSTATVANILIVPAVLTAAEMLTLADIRNFNVNPNTLLSTPAAVDVRLHRKPDGTVDLTDFSGNGHNASVAGGSPATAFDPSVVFDTFSQTNFTSSTSFTHTPLGHVEGVVGLTVQTATASNLLSSLTYGGQALSVIPVGIAQTSGGEPGVCYAHMLLSPSIPQGAQTVAATVSSGTDAKTLWLTTLNSVRPAALRANNKLDGTITNPSALLTTPTGWDGFVMNGIYSSLDDPTGITAGSGYVRFGAGRDFGSQSAVVQGGNFTGANLSSGWTAASSQIAMVALAVEAMNASPVAFLRA